MPPPHISDRIRELSQPTGEEDLLNVRYPAPRLNVPVIPAIAVVFLLIVGAAVWFSCSSQTGPNGAADGELPAIELSAPAIEEEHGSAASPTPASEEVALSEVVVSVVGRVKRPGLVTLEPGARVADALAHAEPEPQADTNSLNHAQVLDDGQQIVVGVAGDPPEGGDSEIIGDSGEAGSLPGAGAGGGTAAGAANEAAQGGVNINTADAGELESLPGVGEVTAAAIVAFRDENGQFTSVEQLLEVSGIGPAKMAQLEGHVSL